MFSRRGAENQSNIHVTQRPPLPTPYHRQPEPLPPSVPHRRSDMGRAGSVSSSYSSQSLSFSFSPPHLSFSPTSLSLSPLFLHSLLTLHTSTYVTGGGVTWPRPSSQASATNSAHCWCSSSYKEKELSLIWFNCLGAKQKQ